MDTFPPAMASLIEELMTFPHAGADHEIDPVRWDVVRREYHAWAKAKPGRAVLSRMDDDPRANYLLLGYAVKAKGCG